MESENSPKGLLRFKITAVRKIYYDCKEERKMALRFKRFGCYLRFCFSFVLIRVFERLLHEIEEERVSFAIFLESKIMELLWV
jgi:hypothetical protein